MKRWDCNVSERVEDPKVDAFLDEIIAVCRKHEMVLGHEDSHGAFTVTKRVPRSDDEGWIHGAMIEKAG